MCMTWEKRSTECSFSTCTVPNLLILPRSFLPRSTNILCSESSFSSASNSFSSALSSSAVFPLGLVPASGNHFPISPVSPGMHLRPPRQFPKNRTYTVKDWSCGVCDRYWTGFLQKVPTAGLTVRSEKCLPRGYGVSPFLPYCRIVLCWITGSLLPSACRPVRSFFHRSWEALPIVLTPSQLCYIRLLRPPMAYWQSEWFFAANDQKQSPCQKASDQDL